MLEGNMLALVQSRETQGEWFKADWSLSVDDFKVENVTYEKQNKKKNPYSGFVDAYNELTFSKDAVVGGPLIAHKLFPR